MNNMSDENKDLNEYQELDKIGLLKLKRELFRVAAKKAKQLRLRVERTKARVEAEIENDFT